MPNLSDVPIAQRSCVVQLREYLTPPVWDALPQTLQECFKTALRTVVNAGDNVSQDVIERLQHELENAKSWATHHKMKFVMEQLRSMPAIADVLPVENETAVAEGSPAA